MERITIQQINFHVQFYDDFREYGNATGGKHRFFWRELGSPVYHQTNSEQKITDLVNEAISARGLIC